jgi:C4-dicarboxylate-specific signal transduction histidine kinase
VVRRTDELMATNQRLAHLERVGAMSELATSIAHELNQPLAAILSNAQAARRLLEKSPPDVAEARAALGDIVDDDRRAGKIIQRMRAMLKRGVPSADAQDLNALAGEVSRLVGNDALLRGAVLRLDLAPRLPAVRGDGIQLQQVLLNLVVNALDAVAGRPAGGRLVVVWTRNQGADRVELSVEDSGNGIAPADVQRVFEAFYTTKAEGLGMGLAITVQSWRRTGEGSGPKATPARGRHSGARFRCGTRTAGAQIKELLWGDAERRARAAQESSSPARAQKADRRVHRLPAPEDASSTELYGSELCVLSTLSLRDSPSSRSTGSRSTTKTP